MIAWVPTELIEGAFNRSVNADSMMRGCAPRKLHIEACAGSILVRIARETRS
jgi:hypothetical protein